MTIKKESEEKVLEWVKKGYRKKYVKKRLAEMDRIKEMKIYDEIPDELISVLKTPELFDEIINEFSKKIEGEEKSKKAVFLSLCNIWVEGEGIPLNTLVSSESTAGKSFLCKNIVEIFPKDLFEYRTKITPEAFTYWKADDENWDWDGKICYLEDISQKLLDSPTFKIMCSEGSTATIVDKGKSIDLSVSGKPVILITTASTNPKTEILNRFQIISMDESKEQTERIVFSQARKSEIGESEPYNSKYTRALSHLKRRKIIIPFGVKIAEFLKENYNFKSLRLRRDFSRLLTLIKSSAALYQFQRFTNKGSIIASEKDYEIARECINYIQTQTFRGLTHRLKKAFDCCKELKEFTAKEIHAKFPIVNLKSWYSYLDDLCEKGMLRAELREEEGVKQKVTCYIVNEEKSFQLPEFQGLPKNITKDTIDTKDTKDTKVTKDKNNCNYCNLFTGKLQNKAIISAEDYENGD